MTACLARLLVAACAQRAAAPSLSLVSIPPLARSSPLGPRSGKVSHAEYDYGRRKRWIKGEELDRVLAAEATVDLFAPGGVATDVLLQRLRATKDNKAAREADKEVFRIESVHVGMGDGLTQAKRRTREREAEAEKQAERDEARKLAGLEPEPRARPAPAASAVRPPRSVASASTADLERATQGRRRVAELD